MKIRILAALVLICASASQAAVTVAESTLSYANGGLATGTINISWPAFSTGTTSVAAGSTVVSVTSGVFSVSLVANDVADPPMFYTARFTLGRATWSETWTVASVAGPLTRSDVVRSSLSPVTILPSQISKVGAVAGDLIHYNGTNWVRLPIGANGRILSVNTSLAGKLAWIVNSGGGGSGVWGGIIGTIGDQADLGTALALRLAKASNLSDLPSASTARTNLGLGTAAVAATGDFEVPLSFAARLNRTTNTIDLATGVATPATCGDATHSCTITVDTYGRVTVATNNAISATGTGDVVGPASAVDNCFARFDGSTGKLIQNSIVCADDSGNLTATSFSTNGTETGAFSMTAGTGNMTALPSNSAGWAGPVASGTPYLLKLPATIAAGLLQVAAPATLDNVLQAIVSSTTLPTISSFANAAHDHTNSAGGGQLAEGALALTDITTNNASTSKHGLVPKLPNDVTKYYDGTGNYSVPSGGGGGSLPTQTGNANKVLSTDGSTADWRYMTEWHPWTAGECYDGAGTTKTIRVSNSTVSPPGSYICSGATNATGNGVLVQMLTGTTSQIFYKTILPPSYIDGSSLTIKLHWVTPSTTTGNTIITDVAVTCPTYGAAAPDGQYDNKAYNTAVAATVNPSSTAYGAQVTTYSTVLATGCVNTRGLYLRVRRTGGTETADWYLWGGQIGWSRTIN